MEFLSPGQEDTPQNRPSRPKLQHISTEQPEANEILRELFRANSQKNYTAMLGLSPLKQSEDKKEAVRHQRRGTVYKPTLFSAGMLDKLIDVYASKFQFDILLSILKQESKMRTLEELKFLREAFSNVKFFEKIEQQLGEEQSLRLFSKLNVKHCKAGEKLFEAGDWGDEFYIIIRGEVYILLEKKIESLPASHEEIKQQERGKTTHHFTVGTTKPDFNDLRTNLLDQGNIVRKRHAPSIDLQNDEAFRGSITLDNDYIFGEGDTEEQKRQKLLEFYPNFFISKTLKYGESFGEIALQNRTKRTATVVCKENTIFCTLKRADYNNLLFKIFEKRDAENLQILRTNNLFSHLPKHELSNIYLQLTKKVYPRGHVFYKQGDKPAFLYVIKHGEVEITQCIDLTESRKFKEGLTLLKNPNHHRLQKKSAAEFKQIRIEMLGEGQVFGFEEILSHQGRLKTATVVSSSASIFEIAHKQFLSLLADEETRERVEQMILLKKTKTEQLIFQWLKHELEATEKQWAGEMKEPKQLPRMMSSNMKLTQSFSTPTHLDKSIDSILLAPANSSLLNQSTDPFNRKTNVLDPVLGASVSPLIQTMKTLPNKINYQARKPTHSKNKSQLINLLKQIDPSEGDDTAIQEERLESGIEKNRLQRIQSIHLIPTIQHERIAFDKKFEPFCHKEKAINRRMETTSKVANNIRGRSFNNCLSSAGFQNMNTQSQNKESNEENGINLMSFLAPSRSHWATRKKMMEDRFELQKKKDMKEHESAFKKKQDEYDRMTESEKIQKLCSVFKLKEILSGRPEDDNNISILSNNNNLSVLSKNNKHNSRATSVTVTGIKRGTTPSRSNEFSSLLSKKMLILSPMQSAASSFFK